MDNRNEFKKRLIYPALIFSIAFLTHAHTVWNDFLPTWDDDIYVLNNTFIRSFDWSNIKAIATTGFIGNYAPLHIFSYSIDYSVWGLNPFGFHLINVLLHALSAASLYLLIMQIQREHFVALLVSLLFAIHPVNVENIAWVSERKSLIAILFFLWSFSAYISYRHTGDRRWYAGSIALYGLSLMAKISTAPFPFVLIAYDYFMTPSRRVNLTNKTPYLALALLFAFLTFYVHRSGGVLESDTGIAMILFTILPTMTVNLVRYFRLLFFPTELSGFYNATIYNSYLHLEVVSSILFLGGMFLLLMRSSRTNAFWIIWFYLFMAPVMNIIPLKVFMADRYLYIPSIGVFTIVAVYCCRLYRYLHSCRPPLQGAVIVVLSVTIGLAGAASFQRGKVWRNDLTFWSDTVKKSPNLYVPHLNLGVALEERFRFDEAIREYKEALRIYPMGSAALLNLRMATAKKAYEESMSIKK